MSLKFRVVKLIKEETLDAHTGETKPTRQVEIAVYHDPYVEPVDTFRVNEYAMQGVKLGDEFEWHEG